MIGYPVLERGFFGGKLYEPQGKRKVLYVDKPFKKDEKPIWVGEAIQSNVAADKPKAKRKPKAKQAIDDSAATDTVTSDDNVPDFIGDDDAGSVETL
jgi:hypothetical protein